MASLPSGDPGDARSLSIAGVGEPRDPSELLHYFRLDLKPEDAAHHWQGVVDRHRRLVEATGARLDIRATAFDYFLQRGMLREPVVVEGDSFSAAERLAYRDRLTGLRNFAYFDAEIRMEVARALRYRSSVCLVLIDLDQLKSVNDRFGHAAGNDVLVEAARILRDGLRTGDVVARLGGDEFALLLHSGETEAGLNVAVRKRSAIERWFASERPVRLGPVTASVGVASCPAQAGGARSLVEAADAALYHAKRAGRNRVGFRRDGRLVVLDPTDEPLDRSAGRPSRGRGGFHP